MNTETSPVTTITIPSACRCPSRSAGRDLVPQGDGEGRSGNLGQGDARYKYISRERDAETGFDRLDVRGYDSRIGRFMTIDPLAGKHSGWSPYHYSYNNPLRFSDPTGLEGGDPNVFEQWKRDFYGPTQTQRMQVNLQPFAQDKTSVAMRDQNTGFPDAAGQPGKEVLKIAMTTVVAVNASRGVIDLLNEALPSASAVSTAIDNAVNAAKPLGQVAAVASLALTANKLEEGRISQSRAIYDGISTVVAYGVGSFTTPGVGLLTHQGLQGVADVYEYAQDTYVRFSIQSERYIRSIDPYEIP